MMWTFYAKNSNSINNRVIGLIITWVLSCLIAALLGGLFRNETIVNIAGVVFLLPLFIFSVLSLFVLFIAAYIFLLRFGIYSLITGKGM